jgi:ATP-dependent DNA ligase
LERAGLARLVFSQGVLGAGRAFFQQVVERQLEGVVAKRLDSLYRPGRRDGSWIKIKPSNRSLKVDPPSGGPPGGVDPLGGMDGERKES